MTTVTAPPARPFVPVPMPATGRDHPVSTVDHLGLASLRLGQTTADVAMSDDPQSWPFLALFGLAGQTTIERGPLRFSLGDGDLTVVANRNPLRAYAPQASRLLVIGIPHSGVGPHREGLLRADSMRIQTGEGVPQLVGQLLRGLAAQGRVFARSTRLARHVAGLISVACFDALDRNGVGERRATLQDAKEYIEQHLQDPDLTPSGTAAALYVSTRTLHRLFEAEGSTVSGWIRWRRLEQCRLELGDPSCDGIPVGQVGAKWGFWDAAHFSRLFRAAYGVPPATYRANRGPVDAAERRVPA